MRVDKRRAKEMAGSSTITKKCAAAKPKASEATWTWSKLAKASMCGAFFAGAWAANAGAFSSGLKTPAFPKPAPLVDLKPCPVPRDCNLRHLDRVLDGAAHPGIGTQVISAVEAAGKIALGPVMGYAANTFLDWREGAAAANGITHAFGRRTIIESAVQQGAAALTYPTHPSSHGSSIDYRQAHEMLRRETRSDVQRASSSVQDCIAAIDREIQTGLSSSYPESQILFSLRLRQGAYLSVPSRVAGDDWSSATSIAEMNARQTTLVDEYPKDMQASLDRLIWEIRYATLTQRSARAQAYLYGPPGTGKTRFVHRLSDALKLPLCHIKLSEQEGYDTMLGPDYNPGPFLQHPTEEQYFGKIPRCFLETGVTNPILFFEEMGDRLEDQGFLPIIKTLFDPDLKTLNIGGLNELPFDYSRATVILSGNLPLTNEALRQRTRQITFTSLGPEEKRAALLNHVWTELDGVKAKLTQEQIAICFEWIGRHLTTLLQVDAREQVPGVRIAQLASGELVKWSIRATLMGEALTSDRVEDVINAIYEQAKAGEGGRRLKRSCPNEWCTSGSWGIGPGGLLGATASSVLLLSF